MLSFVLTTRNAGRALDETLRMLGDVMQAGDHLIAIDTGSTDKTIARLIDFSERAACDIIRLETPQVSALEAFFLALEANRTPYLMLIGVHDQLRLDDLMDLRARIEEATPDLAVINSGWWYADPYRPWPRVDAPQAVALPSAPSTDALLALCPDPRRLVISHTGLARLRATADRPIRAAALYSALVSNARTPLFFNAPAVLHAKTHADPVPQLDMLIRQMRGRATRGRVETEGQITTWADDAVLRTSPAHAGRLCAQLGVLLKALPRATRRHVCAHAGPSGPLFDAMRRRQPREAMLHFALTCLTTQHEQTDHLATEYAHLQISVQTALPGPDYLRRLYDRARNL